ncbi:hypothetical protein Tco_0962081, partial [Tanacetum coccineum]
GLSGYQDGGGNGLTKTSLITHLRDRHCNGDAHAITRQSLSCNLVVFEEAEGSNFVSPPDCGDGVVRFVLYDLTKPHVTFSLEQLDHVNDLAQKLLKEALDKVICTPDDISCWVSLLVLPLCLLKTFRPRSNLECKSATKRQRQEESIVNVIRSWSLPGGSMQVMGETLAESSPLLSYVDEEEIDLAVRVLSTSGVACYNDATLEDSKTKHPFKPPPSLPHISIDHHHLVASPIVVLDRIKSFPRSTSCGRDGLRAQHLMDCLSRAAVAISDDAPLTPLVKPGGGICPIAVGTVWRRLVSKVSAIMIGHYLDGYLDGLQFGVGVAGRSEAILHSVWICQILQEISQKRTRERMSDQEAKEIKAEAREIMPQPSTKSTAASTVNLQSQHHSL